MRILFSLCPFCLPHFKEFLPCTHHIFMCLPHLSFDVMHSHLWVLAAFPPAACHLSVCHATGLIMRRLPGLMSVTTSKWLFSQPVSSSVQTYTAERESLFSQQMAALWKGSKLKIYCPDQPGNVSGWADFVEGRCYLFRRVADGYVVLLRARCMVNLLHLKWRD